MIGGACMATTVRERMEMRVSLEVKSLAERALAVAFQNSRLGL